MTRHDAGSRGPGDEDIVAGALPPRWDYMFAEPPGGGLDWGTSSRLGHSLADYTGQGVTVGIIDDGFHLNLGELRDAFDTTRDKDLRDGDNDPSARGSDVHGTWCALVIGSAADGSGGTGGAYDASLVGLRIGYGETDSLAQFEAAFRAAQASDVDVISGSFFDPTPLASSYESATFAGFADAQRDFAVEGRGGLGGIAVLAAGNVDQEAGFGSAKAYGETQYAGLSSHVYNIVVGGFDEAGEHAWFARGGESLTCVAQAVDVIVPRHDGSRGQFLLHGTSFSTPQVASAVAQMLEANPDLGARDVREILALSSRLGPYAEGTDIDPPEWEFERNGAATWNGGGLKFSSEFGFGALDALAATRLAETWQTQRTWGDVTTVAKAVSKPALVDRGVMVGQTTVSQALDVDAVELDLKFTHGSWRDLTITVVSPSGTESVVFEGGAVDWSKWDNRDRSVGTLDWSFTSNRFWGEDARGTWQVKIADGAADGRKLSALTEFELRLHGDAPAERQYVYTDDFSEVVDGAATLGWSAGVDTLNAAAVTSASMLDLRPGRASIIDGVSVAVAADCVVENAAGGDGADTLNGQDLANLLLGGRGADTVYGNGGADRIEGGDGNDRVWGGDGNDRIDGGAGADALDGGAGDDVMDGGADADVVYGRDGADQVGGGAGNDTLAGQLGDDRLDGGDGIDILAGDAGADQLTGGLGADLFVLTFEDLGTIDRILDMATAEDRIDLAGVWDGRGLSGSRSAWVRLTDVTGGCVVAVDADGPGSGRFTDLVQVDGVGRDQLLDSLVLS